MKVFLAGLEGLQFIPLVDVVGHRNALFSYYHWQSNSDSDRLIHRDTLNNGKFEVICDSGLFTLMFGAGKGGSYDFAYMKDYTIKYLKTAKNFGINNLTIVESDVHKLLGMKAVFELRKYFADCGMNVLHVWHKEEGIDGLMRMAEKYPYISLSIPELRILFKGVKTRYQTVTQQLLQQIRSHVGDLKMPKVHLLGNTVAETMQTNLAYSCDSTSWLAGGRFGRVMSYNNGKLTSIHKSSPRFESWKQEIYPSYEKFLEKLTKHFGHNDRYYEYQVCNLFSALSYKRYQDFLDIHYPWVGLRRKHAS